MKTWPLLVLALSPLLFSQRAPAPDWVLTFADEFNGSELDLSRWAPHDPGGQVTGHQVQDPARNTVEVSGGQLHIAASGVISTFGTFAQTYGRFEIRCRVPNGQGFRPRFVMLPVPLGQLPRIDIFETAGASPSKVFSANRWGTEQTERSFGDSFTGPDLSTGFHTIAIEWDRDRITWFVDGKQKFQSVDGIPHQPMFMQVDLPVAQNASTPPGSFDIDYIRVWKRP